MAVSTDPNQSGSQTGQPGYYYYTPQTNQQNPNINQNFGFQNAMRPMPGHQMMGLTVSFLIKTNRGYLAFSRDLEQFNSFF